MNPSLSALLPLAAASVTPATAPMTPQELTDRIKNGNHAVRGDAWQQAGPVGAPAIPLLIPLLTDSDFEVARASQRALQQIVHLAGRPGAGKEASAVESALLPMLSNPSATVRRQGLWLLSEIGDERAVPEIARLLSDPEVRDDARCALERIPGKASLKALENALGKAPSDFRYAIAESLRKRGVKVVDYPSRKLVPVHPAEA